MNIHRIMESKGKQKLVMVTAYDYPSARIAQDAGVDMILVGDSLGNAVLGYENTIPVTMDEMIIHTRAVRKGADKTFIIGDMPFMSYQTSIEDAIRNAGRFMKEAGTNAVKLEGGEEVAEIVYKLVRFGVPVMGHIGFTPQSVHELGGYRVQGKDEASKRRLIEGAKALEEAGAFAIVLEMVVSEVAKEITESISIPTIGIGSGPHCDGQVLVWHDLLGMNPDFRPRFAKAYVNLYEISRKALEEYKDEVRRGIFPSAEHSFTMKG
ncbi:MAG TPA: 3-methyl-2-oxobutanoate hydroxymethyltransferase [Thermotogae bacterium]|nr:3-methyl-2-oxobutanoate hydroxymethyltransferase [Thermotogota bacterium]